MSHVAVIELQIRDLDALREAVAELGLEWREGQKTFRWYGRWVNDYHGSNAAYRVIPPEQFGKCEHAIAIPNDPTAYEIGVVRMGDHYILVFDFWGPGRKLVEKIGPDGVRLKTVYAAHAAMRAARRAGYHIRRIDREDRIILRLVR